MRTVTFSNDNVQRLLNDEFLCSYTNTYGDPSAGSSFSHAPNDTPGSCGRTAGRQNVQTIFLTPQGEIFHVACGYLDPADLIEEAVFAKQLFGEIQGRSSNRDSIVVSAHEQRLKQLGFADDAIQTSGSPFSEVMLSSLNPQDFGINMPSPSGLGFPTSGPARDVFIDIARQRILKDHKFVMASPLIRFDEFDRNPRSLVGNQNSFFGSHSSMNGVTDQINQQLNQGVGRPLNRRTR